MSPAKVTLSPKELDLVNDAGWILTKNAIIQKVYTLFGSLSEAYKTVLENNPSITNNGVDFRSPKISKGEQYEGLPWVMLDHPRYFAGDDVFAIRTFFWWGNFCSITLQLSGRFREKYAASIQNHADKIRKDDAGWYICISKDPWQHHFRGDNYLPLSEWENQSVASLPFIKLAKKVSLQDWDNLEKFLEDTCVEMLGMLAVQ